MPKKRIKRAKKKTNTPPPVLQQDPNATPEQVIKAMFRPIQDRKPKED